jgi:hypothetical protein
MSLIVSLGSQALTTSNAALGVAVPTGQVWRVVAVNIQQPTGSDAKTGILLAVGTTATAVNVKRNYSLASGQATTQDFPQLALVAGEQINVVQSTGTTAQAVISVTVAKDLIA